MDELGSAIVTASVVASEHLAQTFDRGPAAEPVLASEVLTFMLHFADRRLFAEASPNVRDLVIDRLVPATEAALVENYRPVAEMLDIEHDLPSPDDLIDHYNLVTEEYAKCSSMYYRNSVLKIDRESGLWHLFDRLQKGSTPNPEFAVWLEYVALMTSLLEAVDFKDRIPAAIRAAR